MYCKIYLKYTFCNNLNNSNENKNSENKNSTIENISKDMALKYYSKPKNLIILALTVGCNLKPPLYGPIALLNCTLYPLFTCTFP